MATEGDQVKLIGLWASPFVTRARIALNLKGIEYEFIQEKFGSKSELLLQSNPVHKKVPVLIHAGKPVCESLIIVQYIDDAWPASGPPILPADSYDRATARFWAAFVDEKLSPHTRALIAEGDEESKKVAKEQARAALLHLEGAFIKGPKCSEGKSFFGGDTIGLVDIALGSYIGWLKAMENFAEIKFLDEEKIPRLVEWAERFRSASVTKEVLPGGEELVEFRKGIQIARRAAAAAAAATPTPSS